ncbi:MAG: hypothetical protein PHX21_05705 [bacterium]|nr:hypothetical protein [bacterium]
MRGMFIFATLFLCAAMSMGSKEKFSEGLANLPKEEALDSLKILITMRLKEPPRQLFPIINMDSVIRDIFVKYNGKRWEKHYPKKVVDILKPVLESFHHFFWIQRSHVKKDNGGGTYSELEPRDSINKFPESILKYGKILQPILLYCPVDKNLDSYLIPVTFKDTLVLLGSFLADLHRENRISYFYEPIDSYLARLDSIKADSIMRDSLSSNERIVSKKLFAMIPDLWGFLVERTNGKNIDSVIYLLPPVTKKIYNMADIKDWDSVRADVYRMRSQENK